MVLLSCTASLIEDLGIKKVDLVKLDVEGAEPEVLKGMKRTLRHKPKIIFEAAKKANWRRCVSILSRFGYNVKKVSNYGYYIAIPKRRNEMLSLSSAKIN